jgi:hypothetical protein
MRIKLKIVEMQRRRKRRKRIRLANRGSVAAQESIPLVDQAFP